MIEARPRMTLIEILKLLSPIAAIIVALILHLSLPNIYPMGYESDTYPIFLKLCLGLYLLFSLLSIFIKPIRKRILRLSGNIAGGFLLIALLDIATLKTGWLPLPFIPSPDRILNVFTADYLILIESFFYTIRLMLTGQIIGIVFGLASGLILGWSRLCNYWFSPILKLIGPVPAVALLPIFVVTFPTNHMASVGLIALAVWFPLTLMLSSAIRNTDKRLIDTARVLGAGKFYLLFCVAFPAALPAIFNGLFMGFGASFSALIFAEMLGVRAGLGWFISWAQSWGEFARIYATVIIFIFLFFTWLNLLFRLRDRLLRWQEGLVQW